MANKLPPHFLIQPGEITENDFHFIVGLIVATRNTQCRFRNKVGIQLVAVVIEVWHLCPVSNSNVPRPQDLHMMSFVSGHHVGNCPDREFQFVGDTPPQPGLC